MLVIIHIPISLIGHTIQAVLFVWPHWVYLIIMIFTFVWILSACWHVDTSCHYDHVDQSDHSDNSRYLESLWQCWSCLPWWYLWLRWSRWSVGSLRQTSAFVSYGSVWPLCAYVLRFFFIALRILVSLIMVVMLTLSDHYDQSYPWLFIAVCAFWACWVDLPF